MNISGEDVLHIEKNLADYLGIEHKNVNLCMYRLGCVELVFSIPTALYQSNFILQQGIIPNLSTNEFKLTVDLEDILPSEFKLPTPLNEELYSDYMENEEEFENIEILNGNDSVITSSNGVTIIEDSGFKFVINSESVNVKSRPRQGRKLKRCTNSLLELLEQWILIV